MVILDSMYEEALKIILSKYKENERLQVRMDYEDFPPNMEFSFEKIFTELECSGYLAYYSSTHDGIDIILTKEGINYFKIEIENKIGKLNSHENLLFELLKQHEQSGRSKDKLTMEFDIIFLDMSGSARKGLFEKLKSTGLILSFSLYGQNKVKVTLDLSAFEYFKEKQRRIERKKTMEKKQGITFNVSGDGSLFNFGSISDSTVSIDNSIKRLKTLIDEKGQEEKEELKELADELYEIVDNIKTSRHVPKQKKFIDKLSNHLEKHGWFYGNVIGILGQATLALMSGQ